MTRPRLCATCYAPATWAIQSVEPATTIKRDGSVSRGQRVEHVFYCDDHVPEP